MSYQYQPFCADHEIIGQNMIEFKHAIESESTNPFLAKNGMLDLDPTTWYPAQNLGNAFNMIAATNSSMMGFVSIGMKAIETAIIPPEYRSMSLMEALKGMDYAYHLNQRGSNIGKIEAEEIGPKHVKMTFYTPWPDDLWYGNLYSYTRLFAPKGTHITLSYDEDIPRRDNGGEVTVIHIQWD